MVNTATEGSTPLHDDLVGMLVATRDAEHDLFGALAPELRTAPGADGGWSPKDVLAHLAAWRGIEAKRLDAAAAGTEPTGLPDPEEPVDDSNARLQAEHAGWSWDDVVADADASTDALIRAIRATPAADLQASEGLVAGIGANGANHAIAHLADIAQLAGAGARFDAFAAGIEAILTANRLRDRDSGTMLYNIACHRALTGELDEARRLLRDAFRRRPDLVEWAAQDPDVAALRGELSALAGT
jgi:DinB superfamily